MIPDLKKTLQKRSIIRRIQDQLAGYPLVESIKRTNARIYINFTDGNRELWSLLPEVESVFSYRLPEDPFYGPNVQILDQHLSNPLDDNIKQMNGLFLLEYKQWSNGNFISRRMIIHELIQRLLDEGWIPIEYHHIDLTSDLQKLTNVDVKQKHVLDKILHLRGFYGRAIDPGRLMVEQFTHWQMGEKPLREAWVSPHILYYGIKHLLKKKKNVTRHSLLAELNRQALGGRYGMRYICPNTYRAMFRCFGLQNCIIADPDPGIGSKAIAATIEGCRYHSGTGFEKLANFLGTEFYDMDQDNYDCVLLDNNWERPESIVYEDVEGWLDVSDMVLLYVPRDFVSKLPKPDKYMRVKRTPDNINDFIFCYMG